MQQFFDRALIWGATQLPKLAVIVALAFAAMHAVRTLTRLVERLARERHDGADAAREHRVRTLAGVVRSVGAVAVAAVAGMMILETFGINAMPMVAGAGMVGLAVGFGAQSLIQDVLGGFFILMENQLAVGDSVTVSGVTGNVETLNLRTIAVRDAEGTLHYIPNRLLTLVSSHSRNWNRVVVDVGVPLRTAPEDARRELEALCRALGEDKDASAVFLEPPALEGLQAVRDGAQMFRVAGRTRAGRRNDASRLLCERAKRQFDAAKMELMFCGRAQ